MFLHLYQIFSSLQGHLHFFVHFFFSFMVKTGKGQQSKETDIRCKMTACNPLSTNRNTC